MSLMARFATVVGNNIRVFLQDHALVSTGGTSPQEAGIIVKRNGALTLVSTSAGNSDEADEWIRQIRATTIGDSFEARLTKTSGSDPGPAALGTWLAISSDRKWTLTETSSGSSKSFEGTLEIRNSSGTVLDSATINIDVGIV